MAQILILEDDLSFALFLRGILEQQGHEVTATATAQDAWQHLTDTPYDVVITDIYIYEDGKITSEGGIRLIGRMRTTGKSSDLTSTYHTPVIAISGAVTQHNPFVLEAAKSMGADFILEKPLGEEELVELVEEALSLRGQHRRDRTPDARP